MNKIFAVSVALALLLALGGCHHYGHRYGGSHGYYGGYDRYDYHGSPGYGGYGRYNYHGQYHRDQGGYHQRR